MKVLCVLFFISLVFAACNLQTGKPNKVNTKGYVLNQLNGNWIHTATYSTKNNFTRIFDTDKNVKNGYLNFDTTGVLNFLIANRDTVNGNLVGWNKDNMYLLPIKDDKTGVTKKMIVQVINNDSLLVSDTNATFYYQFVRKRK
ncbi:MAG: hypothetical protein JSR09_07240 [Bacteroidetes bacterium]|nr:hypothetical protein [Bacteroidota bacterium]MBS1649488.1 hypothetical protein [Bacteroidota bacterium]